MINELGSMTGEMVKMSLDAALLRHQVIANNIANSQTPGYVPQQVNFEKFLAAYAQANPVYKADAAMKTEMKAIQPTVENVPGVEGADAKVRLDQEMANMTRNVLHYQALLTGLGKYGSITRTAITGGK